jgi:mono/diheme cytochrome c family protein
MRCYRFVCGCLLVLGLGSEAFSPAGQVDVDELKPGLVATYRDGAKPQAVELVKLDPAIAVYWKAGETAHPRLSAEGGGVEWHGYLNVLRAGNYRFSAKVRGQFELKVANKVVLTVDSKAEAAELKLGPELRLEAGPQAVSAKFVRHEGAARVELYWQAPWYRAEPVPYDALFHLPKNAPAKLADHRIQERGRYLAEELNCVGCHRPATDDKLAKGLQVRQGPDLSQVGARVQPGWLTAWLAHPQQVRPAAVMPKMFDDDEQGKAEQYAVARYLATLTGPAKPAPKSPDPKTLPASIKAGQQLFGSIGCTACHQSDKLDAKQSPTGLPIAQNIPLGALGSKTTPDALALFLMNPHATDPSGRMPNMLLEAKDATDIARYLCETRDDKIKNDAPAAPEKIKPSEVLVKLDPAYNDIVKFRDLQPDAQWVEVGKLTLTTRGCTNCHHVAVGGAALPKAAAKTHFESLKTGKNLTAGCLADDAKPGAVPRFALAEADRQALRAFLREGTQGAGSPAPTFQARVTLHRFNCFACHQRNGKGGLTPEMTEDLRRYEKAENAEAVMPPPLTGIGHKLRTAWMKQVLLQKGRARPWMALRMPQFGETHVGFLPEALAYLDGAEPDDAPHKAPLSAKTIEAGRHLVGKNAFGCASCHDLAGIPNTGTRGPDLALMNQRVRYDWYLRWLSEAQRMQPGTRMPTVFPDGKTLLNTVLDGNAHAQAEAMWAYLSLGPTLPLPPGLEPNIKGRILPVTDKTVILRCFMPDAGPRTIAVGYPNGVNTAFDANTCRLSFAWSGNFLDVAPIWDNRGGTPVKVLGPRFWNGPQGQPWALHDSNDPPDFAAQAKDPAYGGTLPDSKVFSGIKQLEFRGYGSDPAGAVTFRYTVAAGEKEPLEVSEKLEPLRSPVAVGIARRFALHVPEKKAAWLFAGEAAGDPKTLDANGEAQPLDLKTARLELPTDKLLVLPQGERLVVVGIPTAPKGTTWVLQKQGNTWQALLRLPKADKTTDVSLTVNVWSPYRADANLLKELVSSK